MNKKTYNQSSMKVIKLDGNDILTSSNEPSAFCHEDIGEYGEDERLGVSEDI